jgi:hypothetical protein
MNSLIKAIIFFCVTVQAFFSSQGFTTVHNVQSRLPAKTGLVPGVTTTSLSVFGKKKTAAQKAEEEAKAAKYWQGEWVCKDCGYIYNRVSSTYFLIEDILRFMVLY